MTATIAPAGPQDVAQLRQLYFDVYGHGYPVALGSDPAEMRRLIDDPHTHWLTARHEGSGRLAGSVAVQTDPGSRIGKLVGLAVHPEQRGGGLAARLTASVCTDAFAAGTLDSVYATVRVVTPGPQQVFARNGFQALGLLPNAVEVAGCESLALFARHADGVLARREEVGAVPRALVPLLDAARQSTGVDYGRPAPADAPAPAAERTAPVTAPMELIAAPGFVRRRFLELFPDPGERFFPLHVPNAVLTPPDGAFEAYADLDRTAASCSLIAVHPSPAAVAGALEPLMAAVTRAGADYVETLLPLADTAGLGAFLAAGFIPSAVYPAMRRIGDRFHDYVVLSRTSRQIDFRAAAVSGRLQPYLLAYLTAWTSTYLPLAEVAP
ncbi:acetyltransferase (GNAT) family protein [Streptomyces sp. 1114.5]|uniref:GNAT family N-acetyltransferase n=1 Tax=unclassified Streptomyces TaxID=2593676 RepID=UPI000BC57445|nr:MULTISPECIES: GNAT family N-acetyltransferase [unclassified Streptomyces]RKT12232.1 acetyltransferase (GNAT) family protein [Streptomyces sp. 1114.5]SOB79622.1 Acetyltransferase (GNAT) family protein [Streptomyces sp. 1331.2]